MSAARRRRSRLLLAGTVIAVSVVGVQSSKADAAFTITTSAQGIAVTVNNQSFPFVQSVESNAPTAQSTLNSRQFGSSYSAAPDPGLSVAELPSTTAGELCGEAMNPPGCPAVAAAIPSYPYAYAQTGDQPVSQSYATVNLYAAATTISSDAVTTMGLSGNGSATSTTHTIANADDSVDGTAVSDVTGLAISTAVSVSGIHAAASVHRDPTGKITTTSTFDVGDISIAGIQLGFVNGQFVTMGTAVSVPVDPNTVLSTLAASGVKATYLPASTTATGVTSAGLMLQYSVPGVPAGTLPTLPPIPASPVQVAVPSTPTTVTYELGLVTADATYKVIPTATNTFDGGTLSGGDSTTTPVTTAPVTTPSVTSTQATAPVTTTPATTTPVTGTTAPTSGGAVAGDATSPPAASSGAVLSAPAAGAVTPEPPVVAGTTGATLPAQTATKAALSGTIPLTGDSIDIYLALVAAAFLLFGGTHAIRFLGVRFRWGS